jgi:cytochrome o ubiquinol oxidase subunit 2
MKRKKYSILVALLGLGGGTLLTGCSSVVLFYPGGPIGDTERFVIIAAAVLMAIVVFPVFFMGFWFPYKYRASNTKSTYTPKWRDSEKIDAIVWGVPMVIVTFLAILAWTSTHELDPFKPIPAGGDPIHIEAVALDWKWLFIYPDQNIATVSQIAFPVNVPVSFKLTSDTVMTSFFIPQLGSQIYAMAGMQTRLHILARYPGSYRGQNQQFSGKHYADMFFTAKAVSPEEFQTWLKKVAQSPEKLDLARYQDLARQSPGYPVTYFSSVAPNLFDQIMSKYTPPRPTPPSPFTGKPISTPPETGTSEGH